MTPTLAILHNPIVSDLTSGGFRLGPGGTGPPPNLAQAPKFLIGSVVHCFF